ncbi:hypothetical protein KY290_036663 [Solanum tuberosum]|uniref:Uncharacterized protein n=1 Tax=Solanum tuberosum TaxID=4113 RepID=A0ABQ7TVC8_SOLTU|nr:hypothetical protein KY290_036663 [Solanum tuberosum]
MGTQEVNQEGGPQPQCNHEETKLWGTVEEYFHQLWGNRWVGGLWIDSIGKSGGIIVLWDKREWKGELIDTGSQMLTCKLCGINQDLTWYLTAVYAECDRNEREELWWELSSIRGICEGP